MSGFSYDGFTLAYSFGRARAELRMVERIVAPPKGWRIRHKHPGNVPLYKSGMREVIGETDDGVSRHADILVGLFDLRSSRPGLSRYRFVADDAFLAALAVLYHEKEHVVQHDLLHRIRHSSDKEFRDMALSRVAVIGNDTLYDTNHAIFNFEARANLQGLQGVRDYLAMRFPEEPSDKLDDFVKCAYVDGALLNDVTAWIDPCELESLNSYADVYKNCKSMLYYSKSVRKQLSVDGNGGFAIDAETEALCTGLDEFAIAVGRFDTGMDWSEIRGKYLDAKTGSEVDAMLACLHVYLYPEVKKEVPILWTMDLSPEKIFGVPFPESAHSINGRIKALGGGIYRKDSRLCAEADADLFKLYTRNTSDLDRAFEEIASREPSSGLDYEI